MICQILASQIASIVGSGKAGAAVVAWSSQARHWWSDQWKIQPALDPCDGAGIWLFGIGSNLVSKVSIEHYSRFAHASSGAENDWNEGCRLNFVDPLLIGAVWFVGWCVWVKYPDIKKCTLVRGFPESFGLYVCPGTFVSDCGCMVTSWLTSDRRLHVIFRISLRRWIGKAPLGHEQWMAHCKHT